LQIPYQQQVAQGGNQIGKLNYLSGVKKDKINPDIHGKGNKKKEMTRTI